MIGFYNKGVWYSRSIKNTMLIFSRVSNFGIRQDGKPITDVELPSWASCKYYICVK